MGCGTERYGVGMDDAARTRVVDTVGELFYRDGISATGVSRLVDELGMSKQTLYREFGSKDGLIAAVLEAHGPATLTFFTDGAEARAHEPAEQLVALFEVLAETLTAPGFRGCRFLNAVAELPEADHPGRLAATEHKRALRAWIEQRARRAGLARPRALAAQLLMLFDGALADAQLLDLRPADLIDGAGHLIDAARR